MKRLLYTVRATARNAGDLARLRQWLEEGHVAEVVQRGGAATAWIAVPDGEDHRLDILYVFRSRADFEAYEREHAPALRAEGALRFVQDLGVTFERSTAELVARIDGPPRSGGDC